MFTTSKSAAASCSRSHSDSSAAAGAMALVGAVGAMGEADAARLRRNLSALTTVTIASTRSAKAKRGSRRVSSTGCGSAMPVVSMTRWSRSARRASSSATASQRLSLIVQQTHPFDSSTTPVEMARSDTSSEVSMSTAPNSLTSAPMRTPRAVVRRWLSRVVLPAPRKPVSTVVGSGEDPIFRLWTAFVIEWASVVARLTAADDDFSGSSHLCLHRKEKSKWRRTRACLRTSAARRRRLT